jgi:hypothetical protein
MTETKTGGEALKREWTVRVEETFEALKWADRDVQERACKSVQKEFSSEEAAAKLRALFVAEADRMKAAFFVPSPQSRVAEAKVEPAKIAEAPKIAEDEPKSEVVTEPNKPPAAVKAVAFPKASPGFVRRLTGKPATTVELKVVEQRKPEPEPWVDSSGKRRYYWSEVVIPKDANEIEALTYVPGLVGDIVEWIVAGARRPNRVMALGVALAVVGTLMGRRVEGPTGCATHLYIFILAPTGWGKDYPLWCATKLMIVVGAEGLLGPSEYVSGRGIVKYLKRNPLTLCVVDELGDVFQLITVKKTIIG